MLEVENPHSDGKTAKQLRKEIEELEQMLLEKEEMLLDIEDEFWETGWTVNCDKVLS